MPSLFLPVLLLLSIVLAACSDDPQHDYRSAGEALETARETRDEAAAEVEQREKAVAEAEQRLEAARQTLAESRERVEKAQARVEKTVSDEVLFRAVQRAVLDDERFAGAAIAVGVQDRVITLTGTVPDRATREAALAAAKEQAGVRDVRDALDVTTKPPVSDHDEP